MPSVPQRLPPPFRSAPANPIPLRSLGPRRNPFRFSGLHTLYAAGTAAVAISPEGSSTCALLGERFTSWPREIAPNSSPFTLLRTLGKTIGCGTRTRLQDLFNFSSQPPAYRFERRAIGSCDHAPDLPFLTSFPPCVLASVPRLCSPLDAFSPIISPVAWRTSLCP